MKLVEKHIFSGLLIDTSPLITDNKYLCDALNIRFNNTNEGELLSITNEKGPSVVNNNNTPAAPICFGDDNNNTKGILGYCVINNKVVVFSHSSQATDGLDFIELYNKSTNELSLLYSGNLNFNTDYPIQALGFYESETVLKVYWVDGLNLPRVINIAATADLRERWTDTSFDFVPTLLLNESITITKQLDTSGLFAPGVLLYAFTYYNKFCLESNIFYVSSLLYTSHKDRAGKPNTVCNNSFKITVSGVDPHFDYLRIYSILRTTIDATPIVRRVCDLPVVTTTNNNVTTTLNIEYIDNGIVGDLIDASELLFKLNGKISCSSLSLKEGTLFLGNLLTTSNFVNNNVLTAINTAKNNNTINYSRSNTRNIYVKKDITLNNTLFHFNTLTAYKTQSSGSLTDSIFPAGFKRGLLYRLGVLFLDKYGVWTLPVYLKDILGVTTTTTLNNNEVTTTNYGSNFSLSTNSSNDSHLTILIPTISSTLPNTVRSAAITAGYKKVRPVVVFPKIEDRTVLCLGVACATMFTLNGIGVSDIIGTHSPDYLSSWFFRSSNYSTNKESTDTNGYLEPKNNTLICPPSSVYDELAVDNCRIPYNTIYNLIPTWGSNPYSTSIRPLKRAEIEGIFDPNNLFAINWEYCTMHSPDIELNTNLYNSIYDSSIVLDKVGTIKFKETLSEINILTESPTISNKGGGVFNTKVSSSYLPTYFKGSFSNDDTSRTGNVYTFGGYTYTIISVFSVAQSRVCIFSTNNHNIAVGNVLNLNFSRGYEGSTSPIEVTVLEVTSSNGSSGIISGLFYEDFLVDESGSGVIEPFTKEENPVLYLVYPWQGIGSLNNDFNRPNGETASAKLKKKILANTRISETTFLNSYTTLTNPKFEIFYSDSLDLVKVNNKVYYGNIDTLLVSDYYSGKIFINGENGITKTDEGSHKNTIETKSRTTYWGTFSLAGHDKKNGWSVSADQPKNLLVLKDIDTSVSWFTEDDNPIGDKTKEISTRKYLVRMKYKSSPHIILNTVGLLVNSSFTRLNGLNCTLPILELSRPVNSTNKFGGISEDALKANIWYPAGEPTNIPTTSDTDVTINYIYGDTWYSCYDCLKTYPYNQDDLNLVIEIGTFNLESFTNVDGRYDRHMWDNDISINNTNFNLMNPVYSLLDNFFNYRILDSKFQLTTFPNLFTWSLLKTNSSDVDLWTHLTLASIYDLDGTKGKLVKIVPFLDKIYTFLEKGISQILFNSRVLIPTSDGAPIEITNNYKLEGVRYISENLGSNNPDTICSTPNGIYFIDSNSKTLYIISELLTELSKIKNMLSWFKLLNGPIKLLYDNVRSELYILTEYEALVYNERLLEFTSFYSYNLNSVPTMFNIEDKFYCIHNYAVGSYYLSRLYSMFTGEYCYLFSADIVDSYAMQYLNYSILFIARGLGEKDASSLDKTFDNIEFRADVSTNLPNPPLSRFMYPFGSIKVENSYLNTDTVTLVDTKDHITNQKKKFNIWRITIPRAIARTIVENRVHIPIHRDRIRSPWCKIKLSGSGYFHVGLNYYNKILKLYDIDVISYIQ